MKPSTRPLLHIGGVPLFVHWSVLILLPVFWLIEKHFLGVVVGVSAYLVVLIVHEAGHAIMARLLGLRVAAVAIWPLHGKCWVQLPASKMQYIALAWAGVIGQAVLALAAFAIAALCSSLGISIPGWIQPAFFVFEVLNPFIAICNLAPFGNLDGRAAWGLRPYAART